MQSTSAELISRAGLVRGAAATIMGFTCPQFLGDASAADVPSGVVFKSRPDLQPPTIGVDRAGLAESSYVFVAPLAGPGQYGPLILDSLGRPIWFHPLPANMVAACFSPQTYRGGRVLAWWEGNVVGAWGEGEIVILDQRYREVGRVRAQNGLRADLHDFAVTPSGTALVLSYAQRPADLTAFGGPAAGVAVEGVVQEIDIASGSLLFEWRSLDHVPMTETNRSYPTGYGVFDYFHLNSASLDGDGDLLLSARHTSTIYKVSRRTGQVIWRLGGKSSDFLVSGDAVFAYQHHARSHPGSVITLFDNASYGAEATEQASRALALRLDADAGTASRLWSIVDPEGAVAAKMGNVQATPEGGWFVSWGDLGRFSEHAQSRELRFEASFDAGCYSYRASVGDWDGRPEAKPDLAVISEGGSKVLHVSWNGNTRVRYWRILGGQREGDLVPLKTVRRRGFETSVSLEVTPAVVAVEGLDTQRFHLGVTRAVRTAR